MAIKLDDHLTSNENIVSDINVTPLIDIFLVLLIIFMVTSTLVLEQGHEVTLPESSQSSSIGKSELIIVSINNSGEITLNGKKEEGELFEQTLHDLIAKSKNKEVILEGDKSTKLEQLVRIIDLAKKHGARAFAMATKGSVKK